MENNNTFLNQIGSYTFTENGALTYSTTQNANLDLFALGGALRKAESSRIVSLFEKALDENIITATKILFYLRNIRGGQGERRVFRTMLPILMEGLNSKQKYDILKLTAHYGRWDDILVVYDKHEEVKDLIKRTLSEDQEKLLKGESVSLLAKWLPSINTSSKDSVNFAHKISKDLGLSPKDYRKTLSALRKHIDVTERKMSKNEWEDINLSKVPSQAFLKYKNAFGKRMPDELEKYLEKVKEGKAKINTSTLFPHQIVGRYLKHDYMLLEEVDDVLEALWENLPNFVTGVNKNALIVADTSSSMYGVPMNTSVALAIYFSERNEGPFKDHFITFNQTPQLIKIDSKTSLREKIEETINAPWGMNTDLEKTFELILTTAKSKNVKKEHMPESLYIVSDMEFDYAIRADGLETIFENAKRKFQEAGYELPTVVFWNVESRQDNIPVGDGDEEGVVLVSGSSPMVFKYALERKTPVDFMNEVLEDYKIIDEILS